MRPKKDRNFGTMTSADGDQVFEAKEIVFHTPAEHSINK